MLGALPHLTSLVVVRTESDGPPLPVGWVPPGGGGPRLRFLKLVHCCLAAASATPVALQQLESLRLTGVEGCGTLMGVLPRLEHLTALAMESPVTDTGELQMAEMEAAAQLLVGALNARPLLDLQLGRLQYIFSFIAITVPPEGCLSALTSLSLCYAFGPELLPDFFCTAMSALRRLDVTG